MCLLTYQCCWDADTTMANEVANNNEGAQNVGIKQSWSYMAFARMMGKPKYAKGLTNSKTGEKFNAIAMVDPESGNAKCFVHFSSKLGELSAQEVNERRKDLQVVELNSGSYVLCNYGNNSWEDLEMD